MTPEEDDPTYLGCALTGEVMKAHWEDSWGEYSTYSRWDWKQEVASGDTQLGYWEWAQVQQEKDIWEQDHINYL